MAKPPSISACLVVFHEEGLIEECLKSLKGSVQEILVVHDGPCQDKTLDIAQAYGAKTFERPHAGICEAHRVFVFSKAACDWILMIDADERLTPEIKDALPELTSQKHLGGYRFIWPLWDGKKAITDRWPYKEFLFRKSSLRYLGFAHEPLQSSQPIENVPLKIDHRPTYNNYSWKTFRTKWLRWARIHARDYLRPYANFPKIGITSRDWPVKQRLALKLSFLFPLIGLYIFALQIRSGALKNGWIGLRVAVMQALYHGTVYAFVTKYRITARR
jgi:glycosyltransferase involved in cell wall biosynthesis